MLSLWADWLQLNSQLNSWSLSFGLYCIYSYQCFQKCFVRICETSKRHNFLIFQQIFNKFSLFCSKMFTLSYEIKLNLFHISPLRIACRSRAGDKRSKNFFFFFKQLPSRSMMWTTLARLIAMNSWSCSTWWSAPTSPKTSSAPSQTGPSRRRTRIKTGWSHLRSFPR